MELRIVRFTTAFDAACHFYGELLGWPITHEWPASNGGGRGRLFGYGDVARIEFIERMPWGHRAFAVHDPTGIELVHFQPIA